MKLLIVTGIFPPDHGGPASYVPSIAAALARAGAEVIEVITLSDSLEHDDSDYPFRVRRFPRAVSWWLRAARVVRHIRKRAREADVVYLNGLVLEGVVACRLLSRRPVVVKVVGDLIWERARNQKMYDGRLDDFQSAKLPLKWRALRALQGWYTARAHTVICPSDYLGRIVGRWGVEPRQIRVIHNAVQPPVKAHDVVAEFDIVTVARLVPWKGLPELIRVAAANRWSLKIVGDGPMRAELESLAKELAAQVRFAGHVNKAEVADQIRSGRIFVLNSSYEGLPHIVLEAKLAGVAVLATDAGGTPEVVGAPTAGVLVPVGDSVALAEGISRLLGDSALRAGLVAESFRQISGKFSFDHMVCETNAALAQAAS